MRNLRDIVKQIKANADRKVSRSPVRTAPQPVTQPVLTRPQPVTRPGVLPPAVRQRVTQAVMQSRPIQQIMPPSMTAPLPGSTTQPPMSAPVPFTQPPMSAPKLEFPGSVFIPPPQSGPSPGAVDMMDFYASPEYKNYQQQNSGGIGTMDMYNSPYFGQQGSGSLGRAQDRAYEQYLARTGQNNAFTQSRPQMTQPITSQPVPGLTPPSMNIQNDVEPFQPMTQRYEIQNDVQPFQPMTPPPGEIALGVEPFQPMTQRYEIQNDVQPFQPMTQPYEIQNDVQPLPGPGTMQPGMTIPTGIPTVSKPELQSVPQSDLPAVPAQDEFTLRAKKTEQDIARVEAHRAAIEKQRLMDLAALDAQPNSVVPFRVKDWVRRGFSVSQSQFSKYGHLLPPRIPIPPKG